MEAVLHNFSLDQAGAFLPWVTGPGAKSLDALSGVDIYVLVALAAVARRGLRDPVEVSEGEGDVPSFARAVGFRDVVEGRPRTGAPEPGRTVKLARFGWAEANEIEPLARDIAALMAGKVGTPQFDAVKYVLVELLRNVVQHSEDPLGGVVAAQVIDRPGVSRRVQVAVGDAGVGILEALTKKRMHPSLADVQTALEKALHPHFSGTFPEGATGTAENAGLGLYVLSELAKITGGSFLLASRGDALLLRDVRTATERAAFLDSGGFPGTLVVFECVLDSLGDFKTLLAGIIDRAKSKRPARHTAGVVRFVDAVPEGAPRFLVSVASEDTSAAVRFARSTLLPRVSAGEPIALDFTNWTAFSQSYLHALLYLVVRFAWASRAPVYVVNAAPVVRSGIEWIESYALAG